MFVTLEGGEGAGKSTQAKRLAQWLSSQGRAVLLTREPGGSPGAEALRAMLLSGRHGWSLEAETLLHFAARADHVAGTIRPALASGMIVVCDRFADSTMAYQGYGQGGDRSRIATLAGMLGIVPDLTLVLDVTETVASGRLAQRGRPMDRYERLGPGFHRRVAEGFRAIAAGEAGRCRMVDANGAADGVAAAIARLVAAALPP